MTEKKVVRKKTAKKEAPAPAVISDAIKPETIGLERPKRMSRHVCAQWIRVLLQNWRQGTVGCLTRAEVSFSRKKPWKQKGTGRARVGSARSPLWRSGGIIFGPQPRTRTLKIAKQTKQAVLKDLVWNYARNGQISTIDFEVEKPKTSVAVQALRQAGITKKATVLVAPHDVASQASFANIKGVQVLFFDQINVYNIACGNHIVVLKKDLDLLKHMVAQWK